jgi:hypothetical protein
MKSKNEIKSELYEVVEQLVYSELLIVLSAAKELLSENASIKNKE